MDTHSLPDDSYWTKGLKRNRAVVALLRLPLTPWVKWRYRYRCKKYTPKDKTFLLLTNHTSTADHFMNAMGVKGYMRFVASDHLMRKGFLSSVLRFLVNPIPRRKAVSGEATTQMILQNLRLGVPVILYPEGNRCFNGRTGFIPPRTGELVKNAAGSMITYRIDGAYLQTPRWGHTLRRGPVFGQVVREYSREELNKMSAEEICAHIREDLYTDAYAFSREHQYRYPGKNKAEHLETTLFVCPACGRTEGLKSEGDRFFCPCGMSGEVNDYGFFEGENLRFDNVYDWDMWQRGVLEKRVQDCRESGEAVTRDAGAVLYRVSGDSREMLGSGLDMRLYTDRLEFTGGGKTFSFPMDGLSRMAVAHTAFLFFTFRDEYYEVRNEHVWPANKYFALHRMVKGMPYV